MAKAVAAKSQSQSVPERQASDEAILWAARLKGFTPTARHILLTLFTEFEVKVNAHGPGVVVNASRRQLCQKAEISKGTLVNVWPALKHFVQSGNISGDYNTWIFPDVRCRGAGSKIDLGQKLTQVKNRPRSKIDHKSIESSSPVLDPILKGGEEKPPAPSQSKSGAEKQKPGARTLWPAAQPRAAQAVLDKHAEMWTACVDFAHGYSVPAQFAEGRPEYTLMNAGVRHVGGWVRFKGFEERPRDASFARTEFLEYLRYHDPAYAAAVGQAIAESLPGSRGQPLKAKAASGSGGR